MGISARAVFTPRNSAGQFVETVIKPGVVASVQASCDLIKETARSYAPVKTGALAASIDAKIDDSGKTVVGRVFANVPYADYVEFGTGRRGAASPQAGPYPYDPDWPGMTPRPFMRPAVDESRGAVLDLFRSNVSVSI
jgi:HK97 gp10 family phage protein